MPTELKEAELIAALRGLVTKNQLKRWRVAGLFADLQFRVVHPGGGGSETWWDPSAISRARLILELMKVRRSTDSIGRRLFGRGEEIAVWKIREFLEEIPQVMVEEAIKWPGRIKKRDITQAELRRAVEKRLKGDLTEKIDLFTAIALSTRGRNYSCNDPEMRPFIDSLNPGTIRGALNAAPDEELRKHFLNCTAFKGVAALVQFLMAQVSTFRIKETFDYLASISGGSSDDFTNRRAATLWCVSLSTNAVEIINSLEQIVRNLLRAATETERSKIDYSAIQDNEYIVDWDPNKRESG